MISFVQIIRVSIFLMFTMLCANVLASESDEHFADAHTCALGRIVEATLVDKFQLGIDPDLALSKLTKYGSLDEFDKRSERERYIAELNKVLQNDLDFAKKIKGFVLEGALFLGEYDFDRHFFPVNRMWLEGGSGWSIDKGDLKAPAYSYQPAVRFCIEPGGNYVRLESDFVYTFDWNATELNMGFDSNDEAKEFLDSFGRRPQFASISTIDTIDRGEDYIGYFFNVQCLMIMGNTVNDIRIFSVKGRSTSLCEDFINTARSQPSGGIVDIPETWNPEWNDIDMSIMSYVFKASWAW